MSPYTIPNEAGAGFTDQAEPDKVDFDILTAGLSHGAGGSNYGLGPTGVETGCAVTAQGTPDMTVAVAAGNVRIGGRLVVVAAGNVTITAADGTNPRFDLIVVDTAAAKTAIAGTAAANAVFPSITAGRVVLAAVYVPASDTAINSNQITDKRVMIDEPPHENVKWYGAKGDDSTNDQAAIQAACDAAYDTTLGTGRTRNVFFPRGAYRVNSTITLAKEGIRLMGVGKSATDSRHGSWIVANASSMTIITIPDDAVQRQQGIEFNNLCFGVRSGLTAVKGVSIYNLNRWRFESCTFMCEDTGTMTAGIYLNLNGGGMDNNWNAVLNCEFYHCLVGIDSINITGYSVMSSHFIQSASGSTGIAARATNDGVTNTQNVRIIDSEFIITDNSIGVLFQGTTCKLIGCMLEAGTGSTNTIGLKIEKVAGSSSNSGRRNTVVASSFDKFTTGLQILANVSETSIFGADYVSCTTNFSDAGTQTLYLPTMAGEIAKLAVALDWPSVTAPAAPGSGYSRMYVDVADAILKSKDSAGVVSIYGARTRALFVDGSTFRMDAATGVKLGTPPNAIDGVQLADGLTSGAYCNFTMPVDVITGTVTVRPMWAPGATDGTAHTVRWQMNIKVLNAGDVTAAGTTVTWTGVSATRTVNVEVLETGQVSTGVSPVAGDRVRLEIQRLGADGADTYVGAVNLLGVRIDYAANN
jgi:hypothetical protein